MAMSNEQRARLALYRIDGYDHPDAVPDADVAALATELDVVRNDAIKASVKLTANRDQSFIETTCEGCGRVVIVKESDDVPCVLCPACGGGCTCAAYEVRAVERDRAVVRAPRMRKRSRHEATRRFVMLKQVIMIVFALMLLACSRGPESTATTVAPLVDDAGCVQYPLAPSHYGSIDAGRRRGFWDGDSITYGYGSGYGTGVRIPYSLTASQLRGDLDWTDLAVSGITLATLDETFATHVASHVTTDTTFIVLMAGVNDLHEGASVASTFAHWQSYASQVHALGIQFYALSTLYSTWFPNATIDAYDALILGAVCGTGDAGVSACADRVLDLRTDPRLSAPGTQPYWYDGTHPSQNGHQVIAFDLLPMLVP